jgi:hypothetical protein
MLEGTLEASFFVIVCYSIGAAHLDPRLSTLLLLAVVVVLTAMTRRQRARAAKANLITSLSTAPGVKRAMTQEMIDMLPAWVTFPDTERCDWLNTWLHKYWPFLDVATGDRMKAKLNPIFASLVKGTPLRRLLFTKFSLGGTPLTVTGVRCHNRGTKAEIILDLDVRLAGQPDVQLEVGVSNYAKVPVTLSELQLVGTLRLVFSPLCTQFPCFAGMAIGFVRQPLVDCRLSVATHAFDVMSLPGVSDALQRIISVSLASYFTWPNFVALPILDDYVIDTDLALTMGMAGVLELHLLGAKGLKRGAHSSGSQRHKSMQQNAMTLLSTFAPIRPYATVTLTGDEGIRFPTVKAVSGGTCALSVLREFVIDHPESDQLAIRLYDDQLSDDFLGASRARVWRALPVLPRLAASRARARAGAAWGVEGWSAEGAIAYDDVRNPHNSEGLAR